LYDGIRYRSRTEARWAIFFDAMAIRYTYEPEGFVVRTGGYLPDFWLHELQLFFEVKGQQPTAEEADKCAELAVSTEKDFLIAVGPPDERHNIIWFDREGRREGEYFLAQDRITECGFWLVDDLGRGVNIGPRKTWIAPRGAMLSGALETATAMARAERFDADTKGKRRVEPLPHAEDRKASWFEESVA